MFDFSEVICPAERRALREIVETAEVVRQNGHVYLVARVSSATLDSLAVFETSREDLEDGGDHEPSIGGGGPEAVVSDSWWKLIFGVAPDRDGCSIRRRGQSAA